MWDKEIINFVKVLKGDEFIVNCLQLYLSLCFLVISGIDFVVRFWSLCFLEGSENNRYIDEVEVVVKVNQRRMNVDSLEVMLMNMGYRIRFNMLEGSDEDDVVVEIFIQCCVSQKNILIIIQFEYSNIVCVILCYVIFS